VCWLVKEPSLLPTELWEIQKGKADGGGREPGSCRAQRLLPADPQRSDPVTRNLFSLNLQGVGRPHGAR
jgi:hypothetical protein